MYYLEPMADILGLDVLFGDELDVSVLVIVDLDFDDAFEDGLASRWQSEAEF